jgi:hypothetical protein
MTRPSCRKGPRPSPIDLTRLLNHCTTPIASYVPVAASISAARLNRDVAAATYTLLVPEMLSRLGGRAVAIR